MICFCGVDIGSSTIKIVFVDESGKMTGYKISQTGNNYYKNAYEAFLALLREHGLDREDLSYTVSTGYGRKLFEEANETISEISANAMGAKNLGQFNQENIRTIINIGGQDSKIIVLDEDGQVKNFGMNDKCAAGTGRFLEMTARNLEMGLDALGDCHLNAENKPVSINSTCSVFAESEIISLLASGYGKGEIIAGVHYSIAKRIARLAERTGIEDRILFDGGGAMNRGLTYALNDELMREVIIPEIPQITTALGAAIFAKEAFRARERVVYT